MGESPSSNDDQWLFGGNSTSTTEPTGSHVIKVNSKGAVAGKEASKANRIQKVEEEINDLAEAYRIMSMMGYTWSEKKYVDEAISIKKKELKTLHEVEDPDDQQKEQQVDEETKKELKEIGEGFKELKGESHEQ